VQPEEPARDEMQLDVVEVTKQLPNVCWSEDVEMCRIALGLATGEEAKSVL
jgi:hypothetical protein